MKKLYVLLIALFSGLVLSGAANSDDDDHQRATAIALYTTIANSTALELLELNPSDFDETGRKIDPSTANTIDGRRIAAHSTTRNHDEISLLAGALRQGIMEAGLGDIAFCFNPRHAVRLKLSGKEVVIVVCFDCSQGYAKGIAGTKGFAISETAKKDWNVVFQKHGLLKSKKKSFR